jgi:hypothetical protein
MTVMVVWQAEGELRSATAYDWNVTVWLKAGNET